MLNKQYYRAFGLLNSSNAFGASSICFSLPFPVILHEMQGGLGSKISQNYRF